MQTEEVVDDQALSNPSTPTDKAKAIEKLVNCFSWKFKKNGNKPVTSQFDLIW